MSIYVFILYRKLCFFWYDLAKEKRTVYLQIAYRYLLKRYLTIFYIALLNCLTLVNNIILKKHL